MPSLNALIEKYNLPGPRYTSYPPVPFWKNGPDELTWISNLRQVYDEQKGVDLYVHVPYCESLCYYCGCSRTITRNHDVEETYVNLVIREWELYQEKLQFPLSINSIHFGGGTPTFLSPKNLNNLLDVLLKNKLPGFIGSIEIDPRTCRPDHLSVLKQNGITRLSLGIQDFAPTVQTAINRIQSPELVHSLVDQIRALGFSSLNFDLIYGLPKQTLRSISETFEIVNQMRPDLIAFYSYAHLPDRIKNQRLIKEADLPSPALKRDLYEHGKKLLIESGYIDVGMDHFALPSSYLYRAKATGNLHRNFMGYVDKKSPILLGLGPTSISDSSVSFAQNAKDIKTYQTLLLKNQLPLEKGHTHSLVDLIVQELIIDLMCTNRFSLERKHEVPYWEDIAKELLAFEDDGILKIHPDEVIISDLGKGFVRNVAMCLDFHLREQKSAVKFSQTI